jgi:Fanconi anemia group M protein
MCVFPMFAKITCPVVADALFDIRQVMSNDLSRGLFPARDVKLLIVDEAHKALGDYAYCLVARELARSGTMVRIVALSG